MEKTKSKELRAFNKDGELLDGGPPMEIRSLVTDILSVCRFCPERDSCPDKGRVLTCSHGREARSRLSVETRTLMAATNMRIKPGLGAKRPTRRLVPGAMHNETKILLIGD